MIVHRPLRVDVVLHGPARVDPEGRGNGLAWHLRYLGAEVVEQERTPSWPADLRRRWSRRAPDVVVARSWDAARAAIAAGGPLGLPIALTLVDEPAADHGGQGRPDRVAAPLPAPAVARRLAREVDLLVATSRAQLVHLGVPLGRDGHAIVVPIGVDLEAFRPSGPLPAAAPPGMPRRPRVLVLGRLDDDDGTADVLAALSSRPSVDVVVAGPAGAPSEAPSVAKSVGCARRALAVDLGLDGRFELLETVREAERPALYRTADVVVCCPRVSAPVPWDVDRGALDRSADRVIEVMACGVPVVATGTGALSEVVEHGRTGLRVPAGRPDAIAAAVDRLLADGELRATVIRNALRGASTHGWHAVAAQIYGHLAALAASPSSSRGDLVGVTFEDAPVAELSTGRQPTARLAPAPPGAADWLAADTG
jgi:glycosyltransferase involved in cell wall biosynthesis